MEEQNPDESFTLGQLQTGDESAWERAFQLFYSLAFNVLKSRNYPLSEEDLQEIVPDAIIELIDNYVEKAENIVELNKLVITIAKNKAKDLLEKQRALKRGGGHVDSLEDDQPEGKEFKSDIADPSEEAEQAERALLLNAAIKNLPAKYAEVLYDSYILGLKQQEIADKRGLKIGSIGVYINRGLEQLKKILEDEDLL